MENYFAAHYDHDRYFLIYLFWKVLQKCVIIVAKIIQLPFQEGIIQMSSLGFRQIKQEGLQQADGDSSNGSKCNVTLFTLFFQPEKQLPHGKVLFRQNRFFKMLTALLLRPGRQCGGCYRNHFATVNFKQLGQISLFSKLINIIDRTAWMNLAPQVQFWLFSDCWKM